ncbi:MAG: glucodextranase DOMON-like domain-containing protein [Bacillota bacterium]|nr:glucodextranase DOMON-like domain-containing protein [Bacillota bacterium]
MRRHRILVALIMLAFVVGMFGYFPDQALGAEEPLYVALIWHNHQPFYKNPATGKYMLPWVRMHAVKDYYDMASILKDYPNVHCTFNLVPSLIFQLDECAAGAKDTWQIVTEKPASELTRDDKEFLLRRFFDANWDRIIKKHPRYWQLLQKRGETVSDASIARAIEAFTEQDYRDLQVWFNLAWLDPDFKENDPLMKALVEKGHGFTEEDRHRVLAKHVQIMKEVIPLYRSMQDSGQIEVTTTPFYHPIMPLLYNVDVAHVASPKLDLPAQAFAHPEDVEAQLGMAVRFYEDHFGRKPRGLWPSEQAVGQDIVGLVHDAGFQWMVSSEGVLARSLGVSLRDGSGNVTRPDLLYKPYIVEEDGKAVTILFRDIVLSDKIGFSYSGMNGTAAALDLMNYLRKVRRDLAGVPGPHVVTIALDGENCWEYYENDGKEFLHSLYKMLNTDPNFKAVTVEEYLKAHPAKDRISRLHTGSWISDNLETWIGEAEENRAWDYLARARDVLAKYTSENATNEAAQLGIALAWDELYAAEGSDWFWWYGDDQDSGNDAGFDELFRTHLRNVYSYIGQPVPAYLHMPIIPREAAEPDVKMKGFAKVTPDGKIDPGEWAPAAMYFKTAAAPMPSGEAEMVLRALWVGVDADNLYLRFDVKGGLDDFFGKDVLLAAYLSNPRRAEANSVPRSSGQGRAATVLGFAPGTEVLVDFKKLSGPGPAKARLAFAGGDETWVDVKELPGAGADRTVEIKVAFADIGLKPGDSASLAVVASRKGRNVDILPVEGPAEVKVPGVIVGKTLFRWDDPTGDDHGPGTYTYPLNAVFKPGVFDMLSFEVLEVQDDIVFQVRIAGDVTNPWNSPVGVSLQTIDIYIDTDHKAGSGKTDALGGRHVSFAPESAWEYAIWVEGWNQKIFTADGKEVQAAIRVSQDPVNKIISIRIPRAALGDPQPGWGYQVFLLSQEGYPSPGNLRVREVLSTAQEWRLGGGHDSEIDPNVIDLLAPAGRTQEEILGAYDVSTGKLAEVPMVYGGR